ncbi:MAG: DUF3488 domain-containing protein [Planctomycetes bacterium]|nr:DUF3488 domain-containing protein [Planctomycetota bacterium]
MTLDRSLRTAVRILAGTGIVALGLAVGSAPRLLLSLGAFTACVVLTTLRPGWHLRRGVATLAVFAAILLFAVEASGPDSFLVPAATFLTIAQLVVLSQERTNRNHGLSCVLSLIQMVLAGILSVDIAFGLCLLAYLPAAVAALMLLNLSSELERHGGLPIADCRLPIEIRNQKSKTKNRNWERPYPLSVSPTEISARPLATVGFVAAAELALSILVFLYFPRFGLQIFQLPPVQKGPTLSGFSDRIQLGDLGRILSNAQVVMTVRLLQDGQPTDGAGIPLRWRATAHDTYEDATWSTHSYIEEGIFQQLHPLTGYRPAIPLRRGAEITQEIALEPINTRMLFCLHPPKEIKSATPNLDAIYWHAASRTISSTRSTSVSLRYIVTSRIPSPAIQRLRRIVTEWEPRFQEARRARQLPPTITPRVRALAEEIVAGIPHGAFYDRARAIEAYLKERYDYSLRGLPSRSGVDPVEDFLFRHREGHCEHFASAMAILLRELGIPARVATGFSGGEWNEFGQFYLVRQRNAHAWVEAYIPGVGEWETFDPTPPSGEIPQPTGWLADLDRRLAHLRLVWNAYVVNYSSQEQQDLRDAAIRFLSYLSSVVPSWGSGLFSLGGGQAGGVGALVLVLLVLAAVVCAFAVLRWLRARRAARAGAGSAMRPSIGFYRKMEALLRRRGFRRGPEATAREFAARVVAEGGEVFAPAAIVAEAFGRVRYGRQRLTPAERARVSDALARLAEARRPRPPRP